MATEEVAFERANPGTGSPLPPVYSPFDSDVLNGWRRRSYPASFEPAQYIDPADPWFIYTTQANTPG
jgi:hypothetical protein